MQFWQLPLIPSVISASNLNNVRLVLPDINQCNSGSSRQPSVTIKMMRHPEKLLRCTVANSLTMPKAELVCEASIMTDRNAAAAWFFRIQLY